MSLSPCRAVLLETHNHMESASCQSVFSYFSYIVVYVINTIIIIKADMILQTSGDEWLLPW